MPGRPLPLASAFDDENAPVTQKLTVKDSRRVDALREIYPRVSVTPDGKFEWSAPGEAEDKPAELPALPVAVTVIDPVSRKALTLPSRPCRLIKAFVSAPFTNAGLRAAVILYFERGGFSERWHGSIDTWDVSRVTDMSKLFYGRKRFNDEIGGWDTSSVTSMKFMFAGCEQFNRDLGSWDTSSVKNMWGMFSQCFEFNSGELQGYEEDTFARKNVGGIGAWDTSSVTHMTSMFEGCPGFNTDLSSWDTSSVKYFNQMFMGATRVNFDLGRWDMSAARSGRRMFDGTLSFADRPGWSLPRGAEKFTREHLGIPTGPILVLQPVFPRSRDTILLPRRM